MVIRRRHPCEFVEPLRTARPAPRGAVRELYAGVEMRANRRLPRLAGDR
jgi:hypothetical protein